MTTLVYRNNVLASDSQATENPTMMKHDIEKLFLFDNAVIGICGNLFMAHMFLTLYKQSMNKKKIEPSDDWIDTADDEIEIMVMKEDKLFLFDYRLTPVDISSLSYYAMGSGEDVAYGALYMGATAAEAVQAAASRDSSTSSKVMVYNRTDIPAYKRRIKQEERRKNKAKKAP